MIPPELVKLLAVAVRSELWRVGLETNEQAEQLHVTVARFLFLQRMTPLEWDILHAWREALGLTPLRKR